MALNEKMPSETTSERMMRYARALLYDARTWSLIPMSIGAAITLAVGRLGEKQGHLDNQLIAALVVALIAFFGSVAIDLYLHRRLGYRLAEPFCFGPIRGTAAQGLTYLIAGRTHHALALASYPLGLLSYMIPYTIHKILVEQRRIVLGDTSPAKTEQKGWAGWFERLSDMMDHPMSQQHPLAADDEKCA